MVMQEDLLHLLDRFTPVHHICWADRKLVQDDLAKFDGRYYYLRYESRWIGDGNVPTEKRLSKLAQHGFDDFVSLKWEKSARFGHHLPPFEAALAHFPTFMRQFGGHFPS